MRFTGWLCMMVWGCSKDGEECSPTDSDASAEATVDGAAWMANATSSWAETGSNITINLTSDSNRTINLNASTDTDGNDVAVRISDQDFPIDVDLGGSGSSYANVRIDYGTARPPDIYVSNEEGGSGSFTIADIDGDTLKGCFEFDGLNDDNMVIEVREGQVNIERMAR